MRDNRRRNRNIGTAKSGHGSNNEMKIPDRWSDLSVYWEKLKDYVVVPRDIGEYSVTFLVEPTREGYLHHCTVQDVVRILELLPVEHIEEISLIVFRQPTRKQAFLASVWGRLGYWSTIGGFSGPGIYLESQEIGAITKWSKSLWPEHKAELERYRNMGFRIESHSRGYHIHSTPEAVRASQLFRTVPHEVGHYVDFMNCWDTYEYENDSDRFWELYGAKPKREKEVFAHRYADDFLHEMESKKLIPFDPLFDPDVIREDGLQPEWFYNPEDF